MKKENKEILPIIVQSVAPNPFLLIKGKSSTCPKDSGGGRSIWVCGRQTERTWPIRNRESLFAQTEGIADGSPVDENREWTEDGRWVHLVQGRYVWFKAGMERPLRKVCLIQHATYPPENPEQLPSLSRSHTPPPATTAIRIKNGISARTAVYFAPPLVGGGNMIKKQRFSLIFGSQESSEGLQIGISQNRHQWTEIQAQSLYIQYEKIALTSNTHSRISC